MAETNNGDNSLLSVSDLSLHYTSEGEIIKAVNGVSFSLQKESTLGLVGETGAGKTSIAKAILSILPKESAHITGGEIWFEGENLLTLSEQDLRKIRGNKISMIFQDPMTALNPVKRVGNQIEEGILLHNDISKSEASDRAAQMLEMVGIPSDRYNEYPHQFSGGMKQRVIIAIALSCNPDLLLADEPTTALDVTIQAQVLHMIRSLQEQYKTAMILITHDLGVVAETCDNVAVVYAGEIVEYGTKRDVFKNPSHPYTIGLFGSIPKMNENRRRLQAIDGLPPDPTHLPEGCKFAPRCPHAKEECRQNSVPLSNISETHKCRCIR